MAISVWQHQRRSRICDALGNNSNFLVEDVSANTWATLRYQQLNLLGKTLSFTVDLSAVAGRFHVLATLLCISSE